LVANIITLYHILFNPQSPTEKPKTTSTLLLLKNLIIM